MQPVFYRSAFSWFLLSAGMVCCVLTGCNSGRKKPEGLPKLYRCVINLTQEDSAVNDALVTLRAGDAASGAWTYSGRSDKNGKAVIFTDGYFEGVPAGEYKVLVSKVELEEPPLPEVLPTDRKELSKVYEKIEAGTKQYNTVSPEYSSEKKTALAVTVLKKKNEFSFDLGKKIRQQF
jgi:hypothetical protein